MQSRQKVVPSRCERQKRRPPSHYAEGNSPNDVVRAFGPDGVGGLPSYRLSSEERKRNLLSNIYGVDLDSKAVEVTKFSLCLKVLENAKLAATKPGHARTVVERQIAATDRQIDQLVYRLYGLTDDEIALVEAACPR